MPSFQIMEKVVVAVEKAVKIPIKAIKSKVKKKRELKLAKARQRLQALISNDGWPLQAHSHDEVVRIVRNEPVLASETFQEDISGHSTSPLSYLIGGGANLEVIQLVCKLCPKVMSRPWPENTYPPLMGACHSGAKDEVIDFLVREYPAALYKLDFEGSLPIHIYMRRAPNGPSFEVVKTMIDLYPQSIIVDDKVGWGLSPVDYVLRLNFDIQILEYFVRRWPREENDYGLFWDSNSDHYPETISMERVRILMTLLPQLDFFHCFLDEWTSEGLLHVIDCLRTNTSVVDVCLRVPCQLLMSDRSIVEALVRCLRENKRIEKLTLLGTRRAKKQNVVDDSYLCDILVAIASNPNIQDLNLSDFTLQNGEKLNECVSSGAAPCSLTLTDVMIIDPWDRKEAPRSHTCKTEKFTFSYCHLLTSWYQGFLAQLQFMPAIKELHLLNAVTEQNVTNLLVGCLKTGQLQVVKIKGYNVTSRRVAESLKTNKTLVRYDADFGTNMECKRKALADILKTHNTTLQDVALPDRMARFGPQGQSIIYFAMLNKYGRAKMRSATTGKEFVDILNGVNTDASLETIEMRNMLYGLLREQPSLWSERNFSDAKRPLRRLIINT